jgi:hypothetical protein
LTRSSTLISSVCTDIDVYCAAACMDTWQPASLDNCGSIGFLGVDGLDVGGCIDMLGINIGSGSTFFSIATSTSVWVELDIMIALTGLSAGGSGAVLVGDTGVLGGLRGSSKPCAPTARGSTVKG